MDLNLEVFINHENQLDDLQVVESNKMLQTTSYDMKKKKSYSQTKDQEERTPNGFVRYAPCPSLANLTPKLASKPAVRLRF